MYTVTTASRERLSGWGRYPSGEALVRRARVLSDLAAGDETNTICRGEGRSYGDAAMSSGGVVLVTTQVNRVLRFDTATGVLVAEAGLSLADLLTHTVPQGWFPPVTPGTRHVTLGGAVAADVHGKNHHRDGSFGMHVMQIDLVLANGVRTTCGPTMQPDLFWATVGGMGLTGIIATVTLQLIRIETSSIVAQHVKAPDLEAAFRLLSDGAHDDQYTVAWIDCLSRGTHLGRGIVMRGHHAQRGELKATRLSCRSVETFSIPAECPHFLLNPFSAAAFNQLYYAVQGRKSRPFLVDFEPFFYPLDKISNWNRLYGRRGFLQYQFVIPGDDALHGVRRILDQVTRHRLAIVLAVLKRFGPENQAPLSFPDSGYTLAMDLPMTGPQTLRLMDDLDEIVLKFGGRVYLAKDARLNPERFRRMYPRLPDWMAIKRRVDPSGVFSSDLSRRIGLCTSNSAPVRAPMQTAHA